ncbi:hypothetical protein [Klebsiella quasipneumoniae]|uniref:hypothetical protein n=1 Tax=Klebsiella quasipneumoniae TaxID=1463165 RepID=UPI0012B60085|nr:hypothetical protein [Klebsiella pneumoniae]UMH04507.1 hypothetical protein JJ680_09705 [Klebsiella pneumoniae]HBT7196305.1 hypothetical protein [Klebsiella pneumoniae]HDE1349710.1 hypothetical protein [Klebsiella pneumoniae]HDK6300268.1 hypothetical protein [Klebsiella pneumoniae]
MKKCSRCGEEKTLDNFGKNKRKADGLHYWCKSCCSAHKKEHYQQNKEILSEKSKIYYQLKGDEIKSRVRRRYWENPESHRKSAIEYQRENREAAYKRQAEWNRQQSIENPQFLLRKKINRRLSRWIKGTGRFKTILAGCNETQFISHIESQFVGEMSWENYGIAWTFDHITPLTAFDLTDETQVEKACHFSNIQPLTSAENARKGGANRMK